MEKGDTPSPAPSNTITHTDDSLHSGFQQLIQHNATSAPYSHPAQQNVDIGSNPPHSRYSSPGPQTNMMTVYDRPAPQMNHTSSYPGPSSYPGYQPAYQMDPSPYPQLPDMRPSTTPHNAYSTPATSPPTPVQNDGILTTRSGRAIPRPSLSNTLSRPARVEKSTPTPKSRAAKKRKKAGADGSPDKQEFTLEAPLSELVKDITNVTDTDIQAYVSRSPEERRREVSTSKTGKVKRPMNAFMLYRKAYQNRTKEWKRLDDIRRREERIGEGKPEKGHDNHQVISQVCGQSWALEPQELRDQYDAWAKVERNNHKEAFPDYKFAPAKSKSKGKPSGGGGGGGGGNRRGDDSEDDNASNLDTYDFHAWTSQSNPPSRNTGRHPYDHESDLVYPPGYSHSAYTTPSPNLNQNRGIPPPHHGYPPQPPPPHPNPSSFHYSNPGKPRPAEYGSLGQGQYYQQTTEFTQPMYPHQYGSSIPYSMHHQGVPAHVENVYVNRTNSPAAQSSLHSSPAMDHHHGYNELMGPATMYNSQISHPHAAAMHQQHQQYQQHQQQLQQHQQHQQHQMAHNAASSHHPRHQIDPSLMPTHHQPGGGGGSGGNVQRDHGFDGVILGHEFTEHGLPTFSQGLGVGGGSQSHHAADSPHPQQFEQAYHHSTPFGGGSGDTVVVHTHAQPSAIPESSSWQDDEPGGQAGSGLKLGSSDWETTLGGGVGVGGGDALLEDIDHFLGTTTDSPGG